MHLLCLNENMSRVLGLFSQIRASSDVGFSSSFRIPDIVFADQVLKNLPFRRSQELFPLVE